MPLIDARSIGVSPAPHTDSGAALQLAISKPNTIFALPEGGLYAGLPVIIKYDGITLRGLGETQTTWQTAARFPGFIIGPLGDVAGDGFRFSALGRPDLFGFADASLAPSANRAWGFDSQGRTTLHSTDHGLQLGAFLPRTGWDYWGGRSGVTVEGLVRGSYAPGETLLGWGSTSQPVGPGVFARNSENPNALTVFLGFDDEPDELAHAVSFSSNKWPDVHRFRFWLDPVAGECGLWLNGRALAPSWYGDVPSLKGRTLRLNRRGWPFHVGPSGVFAIPDGPVPAAVWGGLRVSAVARREAPVNDRLSYLDYDAGTVACLCVDRKDPGRLVRIKEGPAAQGVEGFALALDSKAPGRPVTKFNLEDMKIDGGSPGILLAQVFDPRILQVSAIGGRLGLGVLRIGDEYPLRLDNCTFAGTDAAVRLSNTFGLATNTKMVSGGVTSLSECGSGMRWIDLLISPDDTRPETAYDSWPEGNFNSHSVFNGFTIDNENSGFSIANVRVHTVEGGSRSVSIRGGSASPVGLGKPVFLLTGHDSHKPGCLDVSGFDFPVDGSVAVEVRGPKGKWVGSVDTSGCVPPLAPSGGEGFEGGRLEIK